MFQMVLLAAFAHAVLEWLLAARALGWMRRHGGVPLAPRDIGRVRLPQFRALALAALAVLAALGGAETLAHSLGPIAALPAALVLRSALDLPFAAWARHLGGTLTIRAFAAEQARRLLRELTPALPLAALAGWSSQNAGGWGWGWAWAWACLAALLLWREVAPPSGRVLSPSALRSIAPVWLSDEGRRSGQLNARAEGVGPWRRIVVNDTLVAALPEDEVAAVLAHEAGHLAGRHREWFTLWRLALAALLLGLAWHWGGAAQPVATLVLLVLAQPVLALPVRPLETLLIRRWEEEADRHAAARAGAAAFARALERLYGANAQAADPEPLWAAFHHPHPSPGLRLRRLREAACAG
jgi:Zn-dependent protease with chaperone function